MPSPSPGQRPIRSRRGRPGRRPWSATSRTPPLRVFRGQGDDRADAGGDLAVSLVLREDGDGFGVAFARRPAEHVGDGLAAEVGGEQVVGGAAGPRFAGKKSSPPVDGWPDAYRQQSAMRFASAMVWMESIRFHTHVVCFRVRFGDAFRVEHPDAPVGMVVHADGTGHVEDVALVRGREASARGRSRPRGSRPHQGLSGTGSGEHDRHVLPAGAHGRSVHDVAAERIARLHAFRVVVLDETGRHLLGPFPGDLGHGFAVAHARRVHVDPGAVRASGDLRGDLACPAATSTGPRGLRRGSASSPASAHCAPVNSHWPERMYRSAKMSNPWPDAAHIAPNTDMTANATSSATPAARLDGLTVRPRSATLLVWSFGFDVRRYPLSRTSASSARVLVRPCAASIRRCPGPRTSSRIRSGTVHGRRRWARGGRPSRPVRQGSPRWSASAFSMASSLVSGGVETSPSTWRPYSSPCGATSPRMSIPPRTWRDGARGRGEPPSCRPPSPPFPRHRGTSS